MYLRPSPGAIADHRGGRQLVHTHPRHPQICRTGSTPARTPATVGGHTTLHARRDTMSEQLDYGIVKITIITGWIPFPWHTWRNDIGTRLDEDQVALIEAHRSARCRGLRHRLAPDPVHQLRHRPLVGARPMTSATARQRYESCGAARTLYRRALLGAYRCRSRSAHVGSGSRRLNQPAGTPRTPAWLPTPVYAATMPLTIAPVGSTSPPAAHTR